MQTLPDDVTEKTRDRVARLFKFVAALYERRNPVTRQLSDYQWRMSLSELPEHTSVIACTSIDEALYSDASSNANDEDTKPRVLLRSSRPERTPAPLSPAILQNWLGPDWSDPKAKPAPIKTQLSPTLDSTISFENDAARVSALADYSVIWQLWAEHERQTIAAAAIFERLYELHGTLKREGERYELALADGHLVWQRPEGGIRHPLIIRNVRLNFEPSIPEFTIFDIDGPSEFYSSLFRNMENVDGKIIAEIKEEAEQLSIHPLESTVTNAFIKSTAVRLSSKGMFLSEGPPGPEREDPVIGRSPLFLLRPRTSGFVKAIDAVVEDALSAEFFSTALQNIVGASNGDDTGPNPEHAESPATITPQTDFNILFTKPANAEQLEIARCLDRNNCVLVQGPPGTGKTHTIANLLGHLLAEGKRVLVVSHTTKALKVLREKVVPKLQPLCVSVLDSANDDAELKACIEAIIERLSSAEAYKLEQEAKTLETQRMELVAEIQRLQADIIDARMDEQRPIIFGGESTRPVEAAKEISAGRELNDWIPSPVTLGSPMPLSAHEVATLYQTNAQITVADEKVLDQPLPDLTALPSAHDFSQLINERRDLEPRDREYRNDLWERSIEEEIPGSLDAILTLAQNTLDEYNRLPAWAQTIIAIGDDSTARKMWEDLLSDVEKLHTDATAGNHLLMMHGPVIAEGIAEDKLIATYEAISQHVTKTGKPLSLLTLLTHPAWKEAIENSRIGNDRKPQLAEHFEALLIQTELTKKREALGFRWARQVEEIGGPGNSTTSLAVESTYRQYSPVLRSALDWLPNSWKAAETNLQSSGFKWATAYAEAEIQHPELSKPERIRHMLSSFVPESFASEKARCRWQIIEAALSELRNKASTWHSDSVSSQLRKAIVTMDPILYEASFTEIERLRHVTEHLHKRASLLKTLDLVAPAWSAAIRNRIAPHQATVPPNDTQKAWRFRQLEDELNKRDSISLPDLLLRLDQRRKALEEITTELVDRKTWHAQLARTKLEQRQALIGFAKAKKSIGKGTGKRAPALMKLARELMTQAQSAVPVWIMPIVKAAEMFDPRTSKFDVVIVDEASQSDITGLLPFYLGKQIIVVGDDEQVSPSAVGENLTETQTLIDEYLQGIPNNQLFDGKLSLYDIAKQSFGGTICLLEHFRCVPEIIQFSNALSYEGRIKPLREADASGPTPPVVAHRCYSSGSLGKVNEDEAKVVTSLLAAAIEQEEYANKTFGVISLVGEDQAYRIESLLRKIVPATELEARRILVGNAAQFQGDERHVVFLSMVDVGQGVPLPLNRQTPTFKQRFNVAASRAQDQLWVVHSLDHVVELKPEDIRRKLIEHALDPGASRRQQVAALSQAESPFEVEVIQRLTSAGYKLTSQYWVGAYRIDMVIEGENGRRLAVECDGERYHTLENLKQDADRQSILERLGWTFVRIRGSRFYRDRDGAMGPVFERLRSLGIRASASDIHSENLHSDSALLARVRARASEIVGQLE